MFFKLAPNLDKAAQAITNAIAAETKTILFPLHDRKRLLGDDYTKLFRGLKTTKGTAYDRMEASTKQVEIRYEGAPDKVSDMLQKKDLDATRKHRHGMTERSDDDDRSEDDSREKPVIHDSRTPELSDINENIIVNKSSTKSLGPGRKSISKNNIVKDEVQNRPKSEHEKMMEEEKRAKKVVQLMKSQMIATMDWTDHIHSFKSPWLNQIYKIVKMSNKKQKQTEDKKLNPVLIVAEYQDHMEKLGRRAGQNDDDDLDNQIKISKIDEDIIFLICSMKDYYCGYSNVQAYTTLLSTFHTNKPVKEVIPLLFKSNRKLGDFLSKSDQTINYPLKSNFVMTFWQNLKKYEERSVRDYFGEKVALYFALSNHFRDWLIYPSILGIGYAAVEINYSRSEYYLRANEPPAIAFKIASIVFVVAITYLKSMFIFQWEQYESMFAARYGLTHIQEVKTIRSRFKGQTARSTITDKVNDIVENVHRSRALFVLSVFFFMLYTSVAVAGCYGILLMKRLAHKQVGDDDYTLPMIDQTVFEVLFSLAELGRILVMDTIFERIVPHIVSWQNLKYVEDLETQISISMCFFQLINKSAFMVLLTYELFNVNLTYFDADKNGVRTFKIESGNCYHDSCYVEISNYFQIYSFFEFAWVFLYYFLFKTIVNRLSRIKKFGTFGLKNLKAGFKNIKGVIFKGKKRYTRKNATYRMYQGISVAQIKVTKEDEHKRDAATEAFYLQPARMYFELDSEIESQLTTLEDYNKGDIDKSIFQYLRLVNNFTFIILFGPVFAQSYIFAWLICLIQYYLVQNDLLYFSKRPNPVGANTVGIWLTFIKLISQISLLTNSYYVAFLVYQDLHDDQSLILFLLMFVCLAIFDYICRKILTGPSTSYLKFFGRGEFIREMVFSNSSPKKHTADHTAVKMQQMIFKSSNLCRPAQDDSEIDDLYNQPNPKDEANKEAAKIRFLKIAQENHQHFIKANEKQAKTKVEKNFSKLLNYVKVRNIMESFRKKNSADERLNDNRSVRFEDEVSDKLSNIHEGKDHDQDDSFRIRPVRVMDPEISAPTDIVPRLFLDMK